MTTFDEELRAYVKQNEAEQAAARATFVPPPLPKVCCVCTKELELVHNNPTQPWGGGEIQMTFAFGSAKFDHFIGYTRFDGLICDCCAVKMVPNMRMMGYDFNGEVVAKPDSSNSHHVGE